MIDEQKLHDALPAVEDRLGIGLDMHARDDVGGATDDGLGNPADLGGTVFLENRLPRTTVPHGGSHFHQAHSAIPGNAELGMIAIMRDLLTMQGRGLDEVNARRHLNFLAIEVDGDGFLLLL
tara:strand:- start:15794 stop:16159 length:366 start_codon:yes stop_codon:yes gene_type:complete